MLSRDATWIVPQTGRAVRAPGRRRQAAKILDALLFSVRPKRTRQLREPLAVARMLIEDEVREPGAWMPEQVVNAAPFLSRLATRGPKVDFPVG